MSSASAARDKPTMADVANRLTAIEEVLRTFKPLAERFTALESRVADQDQQQQALNLVFGHVERQVACKETDTDRERHSKGKSTTGSGATEDAKSGGKRFSTTHKMEFPKFDGSSDPLPWLNRCEHFFRVRRTPED